MVEPTSNMEHTGVPTHETDRSRTSTLQEVVSEDKTLKSEPTSEDTLRSEPTSEDRLRSETTLNDTGRISEKEFEAGEFQKQQQQSGLASPTRPQPLRENTTVTIANSEKRTTTTAPTRPPLKRKWTKLANKEAHPMEHLGITLGLPMIVLFDIVVPCIIYYTWYDDHRSQWERECRALPSPDAACPLQKPEFDKDILGYAIISFGFGELWILVSRVWRLYFKREQCAPLLSRNRWELDATSWVYAVAMLMALIPFVVGSTLVLPNLYLYGPAFLMGFLGLLMVVTTLLPFQIPVGINSHPRGSGLRPFIYYAAEDFIAVDGLQDREFRERYNERYQSSRPFRRMFLWLTLWWELGVCVYIACLSAVVWTLDFHYAFGLSLGVLFAYIAVWAATTYAYVMWEMDRQAKAHERELNGC